MGHITDKDDLLERSDWSFRKLYPSIDLAIKEYEDGIAMENEDVEKYKASVEQEVNKLKNIKDILERERQNLREIEAKIQAHKDYYRSLTPEIQQLQKAGILAQLETLSKDRIYQKFVIEDLEKIEQDPEVFKLKVKEKKNSLFFMEQDAKKRISGIQKRIDFIKAHPEMFVIKHCDHYAVQGVEFGFNGAIRYHDAEYGHDDYIEGPGDGSIVTVVDYNQFASPDEPIHPALRCKMTNPETNCYGMFDPMAQKSSEHATFVASIIALSESGIGLAPHSRIQMLSVGKATAKAENRGCSMVEGEIYDENYYFNMLNAFARGEREFRMLSTISTICKDLGIEECLPQIDGNIINLSITFQALDRFNVLSKEKVEIKPETAFFWWYQLAEKHKLLVKAAGNQGLKAGSGFIFRFMKVFASHPRTRYNFIIVSSLNVNGLHPHPTSVLPGKHFEMQNRTICAIGTEIEGLENSPQDKIATKKDFGTSLAAPFISALAAIIEGRFPLLSMSEIASCILDSATPIVLVGKIRSFLDPVALDIMSYEFNKPGVYKDMNGVEREVTQQMIDESRETYGQGRVHVARALKLASLTNWAKKHEELEHAVTFRNYDAMEYMRELHSFL
jgi:hypothetical protein